VGLQHIKPFSARLRYRHPTLRVSSNYVPLLPDELLYGIDWENREKKYYPEDVAELEQQLEAVVSKLKERPEFVQKQVERRYKPIAQYLPPDFKDVLFNGLQEVEDYIEDQKTDRGVLEKIEKDFPEETKKLTGKDIIQNTWREINALGRANLDYASLGDLFNVLGEFGGGAINEAVNRLQEAGVYGKELLSGRPESIAFQKAREAYSKDPLLSLNLRPSPASEQTKAGNFLRTVLGNLGEGINWAIDVGAEKVFPDMETAERVKELVKGGLAVSPAAMGAAKIGRGAIKKFSPSMLKSEAPTAASLALDKVAAATDIESLLAAHAESPAIAQRLSRLDELKQILQETETASPQRMEKLRESFPEDIVSSLSNAPVEAFRKLVVDKPLETIPTTISSTELGALDKFKEFWSPFEFLPEADKYIALRGAAKGFETTFNEITAPLLKQMKALPPDSRKSIYQAIENKNPLSLSQKEASIYKQAVLFNDYVGEELTSRGYLDPAAFETLRGGYMPHKYLQDFEMAKEIERGPGGGGGVQMGLEHTKSRSLFDPAEQAARGKIEDVALGTESYGRAASRILSADNLFNEVVNNPQWVWKDSFVDVPLLGEGSIRILRSELPDQISAQRRVVALSKEPEAKALASQRLELLEKAAETGAVPENFKPIPDTPGYGPLRGLYVHKSIAEDMVGFFNPYQELTLRSPLVKKIADLAQSSVGTWKVIKTVLNIPSWFRNFGEGLVRLDLSGVDWYRMPHLYSEAIRQMKNEGPFYREARARGLLNTTFSDVELRPASELVKNWLKDSDWFSMWGGGGSASLKTLPAMLGQGIAKVSEKVHTFAQNVYRSGDSLMALAKYISEREAGATAEVAIKNTLPWSMDYSVASPIIQSARRFMFPFISYQYKVMPLLLKALKEHPTKYIKYQAAPFVYANIMDALGSEISREEARSIIDIYPESVRKQGSPYLFPTHTATGGITLMNADYFFPWSAITDAARNLSRGDIRGGMRLVAFGNPWLDLYSMIATSREGMLYDAFTGKELWNPLDSTTLKVLKFSGKLAENLVLPPVATSSGSLGKALTLLFNQEVADRKELGWRDVTLSMLGISSRPLTVEIQRRLSDAAQHDLALHWSNYEKNTSDPLEIRIQKQKEYREKMFLLKHPDARRTPDLEAQDYNLFGQIPEDKQLSDPNVILDLLTNPEHADEWLYNLPAKSLIQ